MLCRHCFRHQFRHTEELTKDQRKNRQFQIVENVKLISAHLRTQVAQNLSAQSREQQTVSVANIARN